MAKVLTNDFSWSNSRHEKLSDCPRAYYFHYYQSWGGWEPDAPPWVRQLYVLKKLNNRYSWAGSIVHAAIRGILMAIRHGRTLEPSRVIDRVHRVMQQDWAFSRDRRYWREKRRKEFNGLVEHEYQEPVTNDEWKANWENVRNALDWFFRSRWVPLARSLRPEQWLEVDMLDFEKSAFHLDGVKVWAVPDFAFVDHDGVPVVVDWKTGKKRDGYDEQVLGYGLYLEARYGLPLTRIRASLVYVNEGVEQAVQIDEAAIVGFKAHFHESVARMRELLLDASANIPLPESFFPRTDDLASCARCVFRRPCEREEAVRASRLAPAPPTADPTPEPL